MSYKIIKKGTEYDYFSGDVINAIFVKIANEITANIKLNTLKSDEGILGALALHDIKMINGELTNVWIEYNANVLKGGVIDAGIHQCIIYDEIPDFILDKYNEIKALSLKNK